MSQSGMGIYLQPRILAFLFLGFASGLPLALTASTLGVWLTEAGVSKSSIGLFAAVATPYAFKFLWSPLMDGLRFPILCRLLGFRRGWLVATQLLVALALLLLGMADPQHAPWWTALFALLVAIASASQDIVVDAYRIEILKPEEYGAGAATFVMGYRIGMIVASAGALFMAAWFGWQVAYFAMAALMSVGVVTVLFNPEPSASRERTLDEKTPSQWIRHYVIDPFADFMQREHWLAILAFLMLYKLADAFMGVMTNPFLIETGFSKEQIATVVKLYGLIATIIGSLVMGAVIARIGIIRSLWICGIFHAITNLMFIPLAYRGVDVQFLALSISLENISGGMGTAAFVAFVSLLTHTRFTATQYALLTSFASFGRTWLSTPAGWFAEALGWPAFFLLAALLAIPGLALLWWLSKRMRLSA